MHRRAFLVAVAGLSGCTGLVGNPLGGASEPTGGSEGSGGSTSGGGSSETPVPESEGSSDAESAGTPAGEPTPTAGELRRMSVPDLLALSREQLSRAVEAYSGTGRDGSLTDVTAATDTFDPDPVVDHLYRARRAYEAADRQGLSAEIEDEISQLGRVEEFLRLSIDAQVLLIEAHNDLEGVVTAIEFVDPESARSLTDRAGTRQERTEGTVSDLSNVRYERSVTVVDALSSEAYLAKRDQLRAEADVLADVDEGLSSVVEGVRLFARARGRRQSGSPYVAAELGRDAETAFSRGAKALRDVGSRIPARAQGFGGVVAALRTAADDKRDEARAFYRDIER
ncbi:hypothetical protein C2R22_08365 [Salinigranum rubrum]|uniref:Uncharacterized protein n=1 Tax=Salinigranum rubrum TaxID=755307 RepID=A0A2I8VIA4_9EURY|nr:hypothetical protein [Salinigranum rubrum]AUV81666.1 hypothetical protein C2R22_08365 [Salinigranum rubrum]